MKKIKHLFFLGIILFLVSSEVQANVTTTNHFIDTTEEVQVAEKNGHLTFKKVIPEALQEVQADIEILNHKNGQITTFNDVNIGSDGSVSDSRINHFNGALDGSFFSSILSQTSKEEPSKSKISVLPALGESEQFMMACGVILLVTISGIYLVFRKRKAGKWLILILIVGGTSRNLPDSIGRYLYLN